MKNINFSSLSSKTNTDTLGADDWNGMVKDIDYSLNSLSYHLNSINGMSEFLILKKTEAGWDIVNVSSSTITLDSGNTYKISGFLRGKIKITSTGDPSDHTIIILDNAAIISEDGYCIGYVPEKKTLKIIVNDNTQNYLILLNATASSTSSDFEDILHDSLGCIKSNNNLTIGGTGILCLNNQIGHGVKCSELDLIDLAVYNINVKHDAFHANKILQVHNGIFNIKNAKDVFATDNTEVDKYKGIVRFFYGEVNVENVDEHVFDWKTDYFWMNDKTIVGDSSSSKPSTATTKFHSGIFMPNLKINILDTNKIKNPDKQLTWTNHDVGTITIFNKNEDGAWSAGDNISLTSSKYYLIQSLNKDTQKIVITGLIKNPIYVKNINGLDIDLQSACLVPLTEDVVIEENITIPAYTSMYLTANGSPKNTKISTVKNSDASYIFGEISHNENIKICPKANSALYINSLSNGITASSITIYDGGGNLYITDCNGYGAKGTEYFIGSENDVNASASENFSGNMYAINNKDADIVARMSGSGKKGTIESTLYNKGNIVFGNIKPTFSCFEFTNSSITGTGIVKNNSLDCDFRYLKCLSYSNIINCIKYKTFD